MSVVLPAYNEEATLAGTVETTLSTLDSFLPDGSFEVLIAEDGWLAFSIRIEFLDGDDNSGFGQLIKRLLFENAVELHHGERLCRKLVPVFRIWILLFMTFPLQRAKG